ncbi:hypothetical protein [Spirosoma luteum]|uniref:hypothetical protein n=1 Tax=Spirosoma luteum TaxID=431553 RepID=UPI0003765A8E|nr:hypothetical protein [Spirosoma luteum]
MPITDASDSRLVAVNYPCAVNRVTLRWDKNEWKIVNQVRVESMTLPAPQVLPDGENSLGFWIEACSSKGKVYQREIMPDPLAGMEQFEEGGAINRLAPAPHIIELEILMPDMPDITELRLFSNPAGETKKADKRKRLNPTVLKMPDSPK